MNYLNLDWSSWTWDHWFFVIFIQTLLCSVRTNVNVLFNYASELIHCFEVATNLQEKNVSIYSFASLFDLAAKNLCTAV